MKVNTFFLSNGLDELKIKYKDNKDALNALADVEHMVKDIEEKETKRITRDLFKRMGCIPDIPKDCCDKEYTSKCICGGTIIAVRSSYNHHIRAKCNKCGWIMVE